MSRRASGPRPTPSSRGSPILTASSASTSRDSNSSAIRSSTRKRLGAMHVWPALIRRPLTACAIVWSRSASASTTNGSLPPSSSTLFFSAAPAAAATNAPARSEPVSVTAATRGSAISFALTSGTLPGATSRLVNTPSGAPAGGEDLLERDRGAGDVRRVLEQRHVAGQQRGRGEADDLPEREVPRHHGEDHADRLIGDDRGLVGVDAPRRAAPGPCSAKYSHARRALLDLERGLGQRLAHLARDQLAQLLGALAQHARDRAQQLARAPRPAAGARRRRPRAAVASAASICSGACSGSSRPPPRSRDRRR